MTEQEYNTCEYCGKPITGPRITVMNKEMHADCADEFKQEWEAANQRDNDDQKPSAGSES